VTGAGAGPQLQLDITDSSWIMRGDSTWVAHHGNNAWSPLVTDHGKIMHLFLVREPNLDAFAHLHPATLDSAHFTADLPALPAGRYRVFADITHESGFAQTLVTSVELPSSAPQSPKALAVDDAFYLGATSATDTATLPDGATITWERGSTPIVENLPAPLAFAVRLPDGSPASLEPYLGMAAHAVVARDDGSVFIHLHPMGTISAASQETFAIREPGDTIRGRIGTRIAAADSAMLTMAHAIPSNRFSFPYAFPKAGRYRIWVQVKRGGRVETAAFEAVVKGKT
jgi:hypothetical protein